VAATEKEVPFDGVFRFLGTEGAGFFGKGLGASSTRMFSSSIGTSASPVVLESHTFTTTN
jgi:hypothetical protein